MASCGLPDNHRYTMPTSNITEREGASMPTTEIV
jgi:hypothetical protein